MDTIKVDEVILFADYLYDEFLIKIRKKSAKKGVPKTKRKRTYPFCES